MTDDFEYDTGSPRVDGMVVAWHCAMRAHDKCSQALHFLESVQDDMQRDTATTEFALAVLHQWSEIFDDLYQMEIERAKQEAKGG